MSRSLPASITALALALGTLLAVAAPVSARAPDRSFGGDVGDFVLDGVCASPVAVHVTVNREYFTVVTSNTGSERFTLITGALVVQVTNVATGATIEVNASGPARLTSDASTAYGAFVSWLDGVQGSLALFHGAIDIPTLAGHGESTPLCPLVGA